MALDISKISRNVPAEVYSGATLAFRMKWADFPVGTWAATIYFQSEDARTSITATTDSGYFRFQTNAFAGDNDEEFAGQAAWFIQVTDGTETHTVARGRITVHADPSSASGQDFRTHAEKVLDKIKAVLEGTADHETQSYSIATSAGTRSLSKVPRAELMEMRREYQQLVDAERAIQRRKSGKSSGRTIKTRFSRHG